MSSISGLIKRCSARRAQGALLLGMALMLALSACTGNNGLLIPNQTASAAATKTSTATPTPRPGSAFAYAFARAGQLWVAQAGKAPQQLSQLPTSSAQTIDALSWSPDGKHLAFEVSGVGNPVDYVIDSSSGNLTALNVLSTSTTASFGWADNNNVIAVKQVSGNTQFWETNITNNTARLLEQVTGTPPVQIVDGSIYYTVTDSSTNEVMLHTYTISQGSEGTPVAITPAGTSTLKVNWDVSPDGTHILMGFRLATPDSTWDNGFWSINISSNTDRSPVFTNDEIPFSNFKDGDTVTLSYSPDGQTVLIVTNGTVGPTSEGLDGTSFTTYSPTASITAPTQISWAPNGNSFALITTGSSTGSTPTPTSTSSTNQVTVYTLASKSPGKVFVDNSNLFQWAPVQS
jgi:hypothetical protein